MKPRLILIFMHWGRVHNFCRVVARGGGDYGDLKFFLVQFL